MPRQTRQETTETTEEDVSVNIVPVGPAMPDIIPTMDRAFTMLCQAMEPHLEENLPALARLEEIQIWYANGNHAISWQHAVLLLEQVLGVHLRAS